MLADRRGWAFDAAARGIRTALAGQVDIRIAYTVEEPDLASWDYDLIYQMWWKGSYQKKFTTKARDVIKQISSHRWAQVRYGGLSVKGLMRRHLTDASTYTVPSQRLQRELSEHVTVHVTPKGFDPELLYDQQHRHGGELAIGWVGKASDPAKGLQDVILPGAGTRPVRVADGCLTQREMCDFYNAVDVICVGSSAEGDPRPLIEGMAAGCFVIATDVGIVPELVRHGGNGLIVERTPAAFARAFEWCEERIDHVRAAGRHNAAQMLSTRTWAHVAPAWRDAIMAAYEKRVVLDLRRPRPRPQRARRRY